MGKAQAMYGQLLDVTVVAVFTLPAIIVAALIAAGGARDPETRCRKCGYILRGISEQRCPELETM